MKRFIAAFVLLSSLLVSMPSYAVWVCNSTNARQSGNWFWHAYSLYTARQGALSACESASVTLNPGTCYITNCNWQPYWN